MGYIQDMEKRIAERILQKFKEFIEENIKGYTEARILWSVLSAIRGPDEWVSGGPKKYGTWPIRWAIPGWEKVMNCFGFYPKIDGEFICEDCISLAGSHFSGHIRKAAKFLNVKWKKCVHHENKKTREDFGGRGKK